MTIFYGNDEDLRGGGKNFNSFLVSPWRQAAKKFDFAALGGQAADTFLAKLYKPTNLG
jgi:hypothetical protein